jgi:hypothetical protein
MIGHEAMRTMRGMRWTGAGALLAGLALGCGGGGSTSGGQSTITGVSVAVSPAAILVSQTAQATATVSGTGNYSSAVTWSVNPSSAGTISSAGVFTPATAGAATIVATSSEDATQSGNASVTAISIAISGPSTATIGAAAQTYTAAVAGTSNTSVAWTAAGPSGWSGDTGTVTPTGDTSMSYQTPYPAPATVTLTATSAAYPLSGTMTVTLAAPAATQGPNLTVDAGSELHPISPLIYGANGWQLEPATAALANFSVLRWGGNATSRYNYQLNTTNAASDWYFENGLGENGAFPTPGATTSFASFIAGTDQAGMAALGTVPVLGWVSNGNTNSSSSASPACSFPISSYPNQQSYDTNCGNGMCPEGSTCGSLTCNTSGGCTLYGNAQTPSLTSTAETAPACTMSTLTSGCANGVSSCMVQTCTQAAMPTQAGATSSWAQGSWIGNWVSSIVTNSSYGNGASGKGVAFWDLDNEPAWWDAVHRDVHPSPSTYDEVVWAGISSALAVKTIDPTAKVDGPIIDYWWNYFYSKKDIENGWESSSSGPCWQPWSNPVDREAHGGAAMIPYYLEQMSQASAAYGMRLLDYLDIHGYFGGTYNGNGVGLTTTGDTGEQEVRMDSVRALWDPTYTSSNYPQPNYMTDPDYYNPSTAGNCNVPLQAPQVVPMLHAWVNGTAPLGDPSNNYPGTKTAIDEYNFGGLESINGAVTQADVLGVFGQYGLDLGTLWPTSDFSQQGPGNYAFAMYRNYDGKDSMFGDVALASCSNPAGVAIACAPVSSSFQVTPGMETGQGQLSVYGALRTSDKAVTVMVINKAYGSLTSTVILENPSASLSSTASVYQYSNANLTQIVAEPSVTVTPPAQSVINNAATIAYAFPAQSITLFVIPQ